MSRQQTLSAPGRVILNFPEDNISIISPLFLLMHDT